MVSSTTRSAQAQAPNPSNWGFALIATGIPLLATGAFFILIGVVGTVVVWIVMQRFVFDGCSQVVLFLGIGLAIAGGVCLYIGRMRRSEGRKLADAASLLRAHRRMEFYSLAGKMGVDEREAEHVVARCLSLGIVEGYVDRAKNEFFTAEALLQSRQVSDCPTCHASVDQLRFLGEEFRCDACGAML